MRGRGTHKAKDLWRKGTHTVGVQRGLKVFAVSLALKLGNYVWQSDCRPRIVAHTQQRLMQVGSGAGDDGWKHGE